MPKAETYVALLRGINVGGHNRVAMSDLRGLLAELGFAGAKSLLQSGNLIFEGDRRTGAGLERLLEVETARRLNVTADYLVRGAQEWQELIARNPFPKEAKSDPAHLRVMFLKGAPKARDVQALQAAVAQGYSDVMTLEAVPDLDPVRGSPDFKKVLEEVKGRVGASS